MDGLELEMEDQLIIEEYRCLKIDKEQKRRNVPVDCYKMKRKKAEEKGDKTVEYMRKKR